MTKAVIFDFDGVLVESVDIKTEAFCAIFKDRPANIIEKIREYQVNNGGISRVEKFKYFYKNILQEHLSELKLQELCLEFQRLVVENVVASPYVKGAPSLLEKCSKSYFVFIASGTPQDEMREIVTRRGMDKYFKAVYGSPTSKSNIIKSILTNFNLQNDEVVFIGDSINDFDAAKATNVPFIARISDPKFTWLKEPEVLAAFNDLTEMWPYIQNPNINLRK